MPNPSLAPETHEPPREEVLSLLRDFEPELEGVTLVPVARRLLADTLTPVLAYRRLVESDDRDAPSFLFESVIDGDRVGRFSVLGHRPMAEIVAFGHEVTVTHHEQPDRNRTYRSDDPLTEPKRWAQGVCYAEPVDWALKGAVVGGWIGYAGYDTVRYLEPEKLAQPPEDDRGLPDLHFQRYREVVVFDHARAAVFAVTHAELRPGDEPEHALDVAEMRLNALADRLMTPRADEAQAFAPDGHLDLSAPPPTLPVSNMGRGGYQRAVEKCKQYIAAGDAFQIVPSQRFDVPTDADPFDVYRVLRVVNPSPYMVYLQVRGGVLVASSPEILCRVRDGVVTSRPLAGTRRRGRDMEEDEALERELRRDPKDIAEHVMLVDLHRNDVGRVAAMGSIELPEILAVERYSHVMHLSSEVQGQLRDGLDGWEALRVSLPVGTVSGAPKVRAMQIIDELEPTKRGPYGGAIGYADDRGDLDVCIALRTMVIVPGPGNPSRDGSADSTGAKWVAHLQAGAGIVADSDPQLEHEETVNKAAALAKAVHLAETALTRSSHS